MCRMFPQPQKGKAFLSIAKTIEKQRVLTKKYKIHRFGTEIALLIYCNGGIYGRRKIVILIDLIKR